MVGLGFGIARRQIGFAKDGREGRHARDDYADGDFEVTVGN